MQQTVITFNKQIKQANTQVIPKVSPFVYMKSLNDE